MKMYNMRISFGTRSDKMEIRTEGQHGVTQIEKPDSNGFVKVTYDNGGYEMIKAPLMRLSAQVNDNPTKDFSF